MSAGFLISYENNWHFARSLLCRKYVKDVLPDSSGVCFEDPDLMKFELFLNAASKRNDLSFISRGLSSYDGKLLTSKGLVLLLFRHTAKLISCLTSSSVFIWL